MRVICRWLVCFASAVCAGCGQRPSDAPASQKPRDRPPSATQVVPEQQDEAIAWWNKYVENLRGGPHVMEVDHCKGCDPNVPHLFLVDKELARLAREDLEDPRERAMPLLVCGVPDKSNRFTDCVAIRTGDTASDFVTEGSGVIIAEREVLTAMHVWEAAKGKSKPRVVVADNARSNESNRVFEVVGQRKHAHADMIILKLDRAVPPALYVKKQVVAASTISKGTRLVIAGFGTTGSEASGTRRIVNVHVAEAPCDESGGVDYGCQSPYEFVAAEPIESGAWCDSCNVDSGGPAYVETSPGTWGIVGIVKGAIPKMNREKMVPPCRRTGNCGCGSIYTYASEYRSIQ